LKKKKEQKRSRKCTCYIYIAKTHNTVHLVVAFSIGTPSVSTSTQRRSDRQIGNLSVTILRYIPW